ncbi:hypothetical protein Nstercoris_00453 [Nitrosomonas stercoris]|uniref:Uncharacterized protein n=1 Tax=Nitrosomonas stercoris TaxID=1444684 RepID=A0A4Y1YJD5_9PROT|nr:hypothetical protein Nstercoris_00453 [Nitrosomonas stercoris]
MNAGTWAVVSTVRAPQFMVDFFINHYRNQHANEIHVFLDDPDCADFDCSLLNDSRVNIYICDEKFWNSRESKYPLMIKGRPENVEGRQFSNYLKVQEDSTVDWILNVDVDEILISKYLVAAILREIPENIFMIGARTLEAVYQDFPRLEDIFSTKLFKNTYTKNVEFVNKEFSRNLNANANGFWGHRHGKGFFRRTEAIRKLSCHYPTPLNNSLLPKFQHKDIELLHFECMTFELFHEKRLRRITGQSLTTRISANNKTRLEYFKEVYEKYGLEGSKKLYKEMNIFSGNRLDLAINSNFLVSKDINYRLNEDYKHNGIFSYHNSIIIMNFEKRLAEAKNVSALEVNDCPVFVDYELPQTGYAYLYCILNKKKYFIHPGQKGELVLYENNNAYFYKYVKNKEFFSLFFINALEQEKFLSIKPKGEVGFWANVCKAWEKLTFKVYEKRYLLR